MAQDTTASESPAQGEAKALTPEQKREMATKLVERFSLWGGVAGLIPVPLVDIATVGGVQVQMLRRISQIYDVPFAENRGKALIAAIAGSMIPATSGIGAASAVKFVPLLGMLAGAVVMPVLSAGATYAIGKAFIQHFASGGTLLDFNPPDYREFIKAQKEAWDARRGKVAGPQSDASDASEANAGAAATSS